MDAAPPAAGVPDGFMLDSVGRFVPEANVKVEHKLEDGLVRELHERARAVQERLAALKAEAFAEIDGFVRRVAETYSAPVGGAKGNLTLSSYDGSLRVQVATGEQLDFGPELQVAKDLVDQCIEAWSEGATANLRTLVLDAFDVGEKGKLRVDRILALKRLAIDDPVWLRAMEAIANAVRVQQSKRYVRFYRRQTLNQPYTLVPLDLSHA